MKKKWGVKMRKAEIVSHIEEGRLVQMSVELSSNDALAVASRDFMMDVLHSPSEEDVPIEVGS